MAIIHVTGPVHIYVSLPGYAWPNSATGIPSALSTQPSIYYLGTGEQAPRIDISKLYEPVANDIAGSQSRPLDTLYQGQVARVSANLNRWNESVINTLDNAADAAGDSNRGVDTLSAVGSAMIHEGLTFQCWLHFPYSAAKAYGATYSMPAGYRFFACRLLPYQIDPGTKQKRRVFAIDCDPVYEPSTGKFWLYNHTMSNALVDGTAATYSIPTTPPTSVTGLVT